MTSGSITKPMRSGRLPGCWRPGVWLLLLALCALPACAHTEGAPSPRKLRAEHRRLVDTAEAFLRAWRWNDSQGMANALQFPEDKSRLSSSLERNATPVMEAELRSVTLLGDLLDRGLVELRMVFGNPATGLVGERVLRQSWYRVDQAWFLQPEPGLPPFDAGSP
jgi:hypothetical protein